MHARATRLNEVKVKNATPKESDYVLGDGDGLQLRVRSNGSKLWNFNYIHPATKKRLNMGLGAYPEISLAQARKMTIDARRLIAQNIDPMEQRENARQQLRAASEHTLRKVAEAWFELKKEGVTPAYAEDIWRLLTLHVFPDLGET